MKAIPLHYVTLAVCSLVWPAGRPAGQFARRALFTFSEWKAPAALAGLALGWKPETRHEAGGIFQKVPLGSVSRVARTSGPSRGTKLNRIRRPKRARRLLVWSCNPNMGASRQGRRPHELSRRTTSEQAARRTRSSGSNTPRTRPLGRAAAGERTLGTLPICVARPAPPLADHSSKSEQIDLCRQMKCLNFQQEAAAWPRGGK